ncbi:MAG TPA: flavin reductase family protein [Ktedonobacteraceae bacterium]|nr:flavin reductase family protein [Ktedonobacteraceae bacterium]
MAIEKDFFRQVMGRFATGVTVVTTRSDKGLSGLTVNSFCSVSLDPLLVLVCVDLTSHTLSYIRESGIFAVNILTDQQEDFSRCFATSSEERYTYFCHADFHVAATGSPILDSSLAFIDTRVVAEYPGGDHVIFLGQVEAMGVGGLVAFADETGAERSNLLGNNGNIATEDKAAPLAYYRGQYRHLARDYQKPSLAPSRDEAVRRSRSDG